MRQLALFFNNPFASRHISLPRLCAFTTDTVVNLLADNPGGVHDERAAGITAAYSQVETCHRADLAALGTRKARKTAKNLFRDGLPAATERIEIALKAVFGPKAAEIQQAFPGGRTLFSTSSDDMLRHPLSVMNGVVTAHAAALPPEIAALSAGLVSSWATLHAQSEGAQAQKGYSEYEKRAARQALQFQLYLTLAHLMLTYPLQPEKLAHYMKQHLLQSPAPAASRDDDEDREGDKPEPPVEA